MVYHVVFICKLYYKLDSQFCSMNIFIKNTTVTIFHLYLAFWFSSTYIINQVNTDPWLKYNRHILHCSAKVIIKKFVLFFKKIQIGLYLFSFVFVSCLKTKSIQTASFIDRSSSKKVSFVSNAKSLSSALVYFGKLSR